MKSILKTWTLVAVFALASTITFAQQNTTNLLASTTTAEVTTVPTSNVNTILEDIKQQLATNIEFPAELQGYYNSPVKVAVSFDVTTEGAIENVRIASGVSKLFKEEVTKKLNQLKVAPVVENGKATTQQVNVSVVFQP